MAGLTRWPCVQANLQDGVAADGEVRHEVAFVVQ
jgi:hypothetical protein